jgi:hypothetical protein
MALVWSAGQPSRERPGTNFQSLITGDPVYRIAQANYNRSLQTGRNALRDQIRQLVIGSGFNPTADMTADELKAYGSDVDAATLAAAAKNPFSIKAQLDATRNAGAGNLRYNLAARGLGQSGAVPVGQSVLNMQYQQGSYNKMQDLLTALRGDIGDYTNLQNTQQGLLSQAGLGVANRLAQTPGAVPTAPRFDPATSALRQRSLGMAKVPASALAHYGG